MPRTINPLDLSARIAEVCGLARRSRLCTACGASEDGQRCRHCGGSAFEVVAPRGFNRQRQRGKGPREYVSRMPAWPEHAMLVHKVHATGRKGGD